jgi:hypothetical protein
VHVKEEDGARVHAERTEEKQEEQGKSHREREINHIDGRGEGGTEGRNGPRISVLGERGAEEEHGEGVQKGW